MSLISDKKNILNQISVLSSLGQKVELPQNTNTFGSLNNKKEPLPFLLDLLTQMKGNTAVASSMGTLLTTFVDDVEPQLKATLKQQLTPFNSNEQLPAPFTTAGYTVPVKSIDSSNKLKTSPNSDAGQLIYGDKTNNFDRKAYDAITTAGTDVSFNNTTLRYNEGLDSFTIKPSGSATIGSFVSSYIDGITLVDKKEFNATILNEIFGTTTKSQGKSLEDIMEEEKLDRLVDKLISEQDLELSDDEISDIEIAATNKINGVNKLDLGCGYFDTEVDLDRMSDLIRNVSGTTNPETAVVEYNKILLDSTNGAVLGKDENTAKDNFIKRIIKAIQKFFVKAITISPQIMVLKYIVAGFKNGSIFLPLDVTGEFKNSKKISECLTKEVKHNINKFYFDLIKAILIKLAINAGREILREKMQGYSNILKSLT